MKITEIKWEQGKRYKVEYRIQNFEVIVDFGELKRTDGTGLNLVDEWQLEYILQMEFTEVITSVDFITAYKDCFENGTKYFNEYHHQIMYKQPDGTVEIEEKSGEYDYGVVVINCDWIKED